VFGCEITSPSALILNRVLVIAVLLCYQEGEGCIFFVEKKAIVSSFV
jgi:uncharacterized membrane protein